MYRHSEIKGDSKVIRVSNKIISAIEAEATFKDTYSSVLEKLLELKK